MHSFIHSYSGMRIQLKICVNLLHGANYFQFNVIPLLCGMGLSIVHTVTLSRPHLLRLTRDLKYLSHSIGTISYMHSLLEIRGNSL